MQQECYWSQLKQNQQGRTHCHCPLLSFEMVCNLLPMQSKCCHFHAITNKRRFTTLEFDLSKTEILPVLLSCTLYFCFCLSVFWEAGYHHLQCSPGLVSPRIQRMKGAYQLKGFHPWSNICWNKHQQQKGTLLSALVIYTPKRKKKRKENHTRIELSYNGRSINAISTDITECISLLSKK